MVKVINLFFLLASTTCTFINLEKDLESVVWLSDNFGQDLDVLPYYALEMKEIMTRILESDPVSLMEGMARLNSLEKFVAFWNNYDLVTKPKLKHEHLLISEIDQLVLDNVLTNFKCYVLEKMLNIKEETKENQERFYEAAMNVGNIWLRKFKGHEFILNSLPKQCQLLLANDPRSLIISEFYRLSRILFDERSTYKSGDFRIHLENFYMLVRYFTSRPDDLYGLTWVINQSREFIFLYLLFHKNPCLLKTCRDKKNFTTYFTNSCNLRVMTLWSLSDLVPIFYFSLQDKDLTLKFYDLSHYVNPIISDNSLLESWITKFVSKIMQVSIEDIIR
jgi:hypothetical protein